MIAFNRVVVVVLWDVRGGGDQVVVYPQVLAAWSVVTSTALGRTARPDEEPAGGGGIPLLGQQDVDYLAVLVDCSVQVPPPAGDLDLVSSTNLRSPVACRSGRAVSTTSG
jgi:hypothetical protein